MKELFSQEEQAQEGHQSQYQVVFRELDEAKQAEAKDPYEWMNPCDRWVVGKPADKACWAYVDRISETRDRNSRILTMIYASSMPFPVNLIFVLVVGLKWWRKRK